MLLPEAESLSCKAQPVTVGAQFRADPSGHCLCCCFLGGHAVALSCGALRARLARRSSGLTLWAPARPAGPDRDGRLFFISMRGPAV